LMTDPAPASQFSLCALMLARARRTAMRPLVSYVRVSTSRKGRSGLSLPPSTSTHDFGERIGNGLQTRSPNSSWH
jgi:hypothetical protein